MLKICTLAQRLTHCYCSIITNLVPAKTEWKRQHITQQIKLFDYWGTYCKCLHHMTHITNVNVCNSQSTVQHAQHWRWKNYAQLPDDNIMSCVFCRSFAAKKKNWDEQQQTAKYAFGTIVTKSSYWWGKSSGPIWFVCSMVISTHAIGLHCYCYALLHMNIIKSTLHSHSTLLHFMHLQEAMHCEHCLEGSQLYMINHALPIMSLEFMPLEQQWL